MIRDRLERLALAIDNRRHGYGEHAELSPLEAARDELDLQALELARAVDELLEFIPNEASPVVLARDVLAPVVGALDAYADAGDNLTTESERADG